MMAVADEKEFHVTIHEDVELHRASISIVCLGNEIITPQDNVEYKDIDTRELYPRGDRKKIYLKKDEENLDTRGIYTGISAAELWINDDKALEWEISDGNLSKTERHMALVLVYEE